MSTFWKVLIGLAVALPMAAYVAGSFSASGAGDLPRHDPIVIRDAPGQSTDDRPILRPKADDDAGDEDGNDDDQDDDVVIVNPKPTRVGEGDDDDDRDTDDDSDDGGGDDSRDSGDD